MGETLFLDWVKFSDIDTGEGDKAKQRRHVSLKGTDELIDHEKFIWRRDIINHRMLALEGMIETT